MITEKEFKGSVTLEQTLDRVFTVFINKEEYYAYLKVDCFRGRMEMDEFGEIIGDLQRVTNSIHHNIFFDYYLGIAKTKEEAMNNIKLLSFSDIYIENFKNTLKIDELVDNKVYLIENNPNTFASYLVK